MNPRLLFAAALALPLAGLGATWGWSHARAQQGTVWEVPVSGYDPRDLLQGHYVQYRYDWPGLSDDSRLYGAPRLCLVGRAPQIEAVHPDVGQTCTSAVRAQRDDGGMAAPLVSGRLYVPQTAAAGLERKLADSALEAVLRFRLRDDGVLTPLVLTFRPASPAARARATEPPPPPIQQ